LFVSGGVNQSRHSPLCCRSGTNPKHRDGGNSSASEPGQRLDQWGPPPKWFWFSEQLFSYYSHTVETRKRKCLTKVLPLTGLSLRRMDDFSRQTRRGKQPQTRNPEKWVEYSIVVTNRSLDRDKTKLPHSLANEIQDVNLVNKPKGF
jgi:hypothetical protein